MSSRRSGMLGDEEFDGLGPGSPRILVRVPLRRGHLGQERLHLVRVIEQLPVQVAGSHSMRTPPRSKTTVVGRVAAGIPNASGRTRGQLRDGKDAVRRGCLSDVIRERPAETEC